MYLIDINSSPSKRGGAGFEIAGLTKKTCLPSVLICRIIQLRKLKPQGGILVFRGEQEAREFNNVRDVAFTKVKLCPDLGRVGIYSAFDLAAHIDKKNWNQQQ